MTRKMKDSGIEWIGEIPEDWKLCRLKNLLAIPMQYGANDSGEEFDENEPRYIRITDITMDNKLADEGKLSLPLDRAKPYLLEDGDLLFARSGATVGKTFIYKDEFGLAAFAGYLIRGKFNKKALPKFIFYYTLSNSYIEWKNSIFIQATIQNIGANKYSNMEIAIPTEEKQKYIIKYLDDKCALIDETIEKHKLAIEKLKAYKQSVITEAVTKGLNPDVPMKDSGIEWIGEIPEHWNVCKLMYLAKMRSGNSITSESIDNSGEYPVYGGNGLRGYTNSYTNQGTYILIGRQGALCGNVRIVEGAFWASEHAIVLYELIKLNKNWFAYNLQIMNLNQYSTSAAQPGLAVEQISKLYTCVPPIGEQNNIANYLNNKCSKVDNTITKKEALMGKLIEYKKSLIYEYVTGKREV